MSGCSNENTWLLGYILKSLRKYLLSISVLLSIYCAHLPRLFHHQILLEKNLDNWWSYKCCERYICWWWFWWWVESSKMILDSSSELKWRKLQVMRKPIPQLRQTPILQMEEDSKRGEDQGQGDGFLESAKATSKIKERGSSGGQMERTRLSNNSANLHKRF